MTGKRFVEILDKNVDEKQLAKDLAMELIVPFLEEKLSKLDLIPGTDIDNQVIQKVLAYLKAQAIGEVAPVQE